MPVRLDRNRLVTLTGAGGSGKTRLALEAATARLGAGHDGVWLVELAGLGDPALVPAAIASALGLTLPAQRPALEGLGAQLSQSRRLLILDNCEHLIDGLCRSGRTPAGRLLGAAYPGHEPRAAARPGRGVLAGPVVDTAGPGSVGEAFGAGLI